MQELLYRKFTTMRHVSVIQNFDIDAFLQSNRLPSTFIALEIQNNLILLQNESNAANLIEWSYYKHARTLSFPEYVLNKIFHDFLPCRVLVLSFRRILNHIEHSIELRCSLYSVC